jgi:hypothetical protein
VRHDPDSKKTQRGRILALLVAERGAWVGLPAILGLHVAQYNSRLLELRRMGFRIENRREGKHSWFRLVTGQTAPAPEADTLFGDLSRDRTYLE